MNSKYLGMALGASMSLCAPALASAATLTIDDLTDSVSFSFTGFTSFAAIAAVEWQHYWVLHVDHTSRSDRDPLL